MLSCNSRTRGCHKSLLLLCFYRRGTYVVPPEITPQPKAPVVSAWQTQQPSAGFQPAMQSSFFHSCYVPILMRQLINMLLLSFLSRRGTYVVPPEITTQPKAPVVNAWQTQQPSACFQPAMQSRPDTEDEIDDRQPDEGGYLRLHINTNTNNSLSCTHES